MVPTHKKKPSPRGEGLLGPQGLEAKVSYIYLILPVLPIEINHKFTEILLNKLYLANKGINKG